MSEQSVKGYPSTDLAKTGEEIELLSAIQAQLKSLDRITPCKRRDSLQVALTEMLEKPEYQQPSRLISERNGLASEVARLKAELEKIKSSNGSEKSETPVQNFEFPASPTEKPKGCLGGALAFGLVMIAAIVLIAMRSHLHL